MKKFRDSALTYWAISDMEQAQRKQIMVIANGEESDRRTNLLELVQLCRAIKRKLN